MAASVIDGVGRGGRLVVALAMLVGPSAADAAPLRFERVFGTTGEPAALHYRVAYRSGATVHWMDVWRDGNRRIRRSTDGAITTFAYRAPGDAGYRLSVLDEQRHRRTDIDRTNLYRIGNFADWYDLAHGLRRPKGAYVLTRAAHPPATPAVAPARAAIAPCTWYDLTEGTRTTRICWDAANRIPLLMTGAGGRMIWRVATIDRHPIAARLFTIDDRKYIRTNANQDIEQD